MHSSCWLVGRRGADLTAAIELAYPFPYTGKAAPLMAREASDARNLITSAIAAGSTHLLKSPLGTAARFCGVSIVPGMMQLTLMLDPFNSAARDSVNRSTALFEAL